MWCLAAHTAQPDFMTVSRYHSPGLHVRSQYHRGCNSSRCQQGELGWEVWRSIPLFGCIFANRGFFMDAPTWHTVPREYGNRCFLWREVCHGGRGQQGSGCSSGKTLRSKGDAAACERGCAPRQPSRKWHK